MKFEKPSSIRLVLFGSAAFWNVSIGMTHVMIPLYALSLGFSILRIAAVVAIPVLATLGVRFMGGALSDRFGERRILQSCYLLNTVSAIVLLQADGLVSLLVAVTVSNMSRSFFWTPAQSMASQIPGATAGKSLGQLSACNAAGSMTGMATGGALVALLGYSGAFQVLAVTTLGASILGFFLPPVEEKPRGRSVWKNLVGIGTFLCYRRTWLVISASFAAGLTPALCLSIYPVYLAQLGHGEEWIGVTLSMRGLGPIINGLLIASFITPSRQAVFYAVGLTILGLFLLGTGSLSQLVLLALCIAGLGIGGGLMDVWYQVQATDLSTSSNRSAAMASMGLGWNFAYIVTPLTVGWLVELGGFRFGLLTTGAFFLLIATGTRLWYRLLAPPGSGLQVPSTQIDVGVTETTKGQ